MPDNKDNKPPDDDSPFNSSGELFETLFREELDTLTNGQKEKKGAPKTEKKTSVAERPKSSSQEKRVAPRKPVPQKGAEAKNIPKQKPVSRVHVDTPQRVSTKPAAKTSKVVEQRHVSGDMGNASQRPSAKPAAKTSAVVEQRHVSGDMGDGSEEVRPKKREKFGKIRRRKIGSKPKLGGGSDKIKIAMLCVILVAAVAFIVNTLGIVDLGGLLGLSEPTKKERIKPRVAKKPPAKTNQKTTRVAIKPPQKRPSPQAVNKPTIQKKTLIVKPPPQAAPSQAQPRTPKNSAQPTATSKKPLVVQQRYRPATPTEQPPAVQQPSRPPAPEQRPVVVMKPPPPPPPTQKPVVNKEPYRPAPSQPRPVVVKKPQPMATFKPPPVVKEPTRSSTQSRKKPELGKEELFPEESALPYPYSVYLGAYKTPERAEKAISMHRNEGLSAYWVEVDLGDKGIWYRVFTGYFRDQKQADAFIRRKRIADAKVKRTKYAALIGIYATERDAQKEFLALSRLGYSPYVIETDSGESQLYVGAFYTEIGAEEQRSDLASKGIQSRVVER